jgi:hypothetical protein
MGEPVTHRFLRRAIIFASILILVAALTGASACRHGLKIDITNQTGETLYIFYRTEPGIGEETSLGTLDPGTELGVASWQAQALTVIGKNAGGEIVYQHRFTFSIFSSGEAAVFITPGDLTHPTR